MIQATELNFRYRQESILSDLNFCVKPGEIFGVIGQNGSGKTTLLKILSGFLNSYTGTVRIAGKDLKTYSQRELARTIAVVPQETHISFPFTALEIALMGRSPHLGAMELEKGEDLEIARWAMRQTDTLQFATRPVHELSGGEKQRVMIARALVQQSDLLILDEPTAFLDIKYQIDVCRLLRQLNQDRSLTVLAVFHDLNLSAMYCHRLLLLHEGRLFKLGTPEEVITYSNIKAAYDAEVYVGINDLTGLPYYMPME